MPGVRRVVQYSGLGFAEALELPCDTFQLMLKNSVVEELNGSPEGKKYLEDCKRLAAAEPDLAGLQKFMRKGGGEDG